MLKDPRMIFLLAVFVFILLIIAYWYMFQPIISWVYLVPDVHDDIELYIDKKYIDFDDGKAFEYALSTVPFFDDKKVVAFAYYDNRKSDNLFYGRMCDAYVIDLDLGEQYESAIEYTVNTGRECYSIGDYSIYWLRDSVSNINNSFYVAFCDEECKIRLIMITEYENIESNAVVVYDVILKRFNINWECDVDFT